MGSITTCPMSLGCSISPIEHALHGTYWHNNFGMPMSHGCVNLPLDVAAWLYDWALSARRS